MRNKHLHLVVSLRASMRAWQSTILGYPNTVDCFAYARNDRENMPPPEGAIAPKGAACMNEILQPKASE